MGIFNKLTPCLLVTAFFLACMSAYGADFESLRGENPPANGIWLETLDLRNMAQGYGSPQAGRSVEGNPITLGGEKYLHGVGSHAEGSFLIRLNKSATKFVAMVGVDGECPNTGSVVFQVLVDSKKKFDSGILRGGDPAKPVSVNLKGAKYLHLVITDAGDGKGADHADWAGAAIILSPNTKARPESIIEEISEPMKIAFSNSKKPAIHGPRIVGATPGNDFMFLIPATGDGPLTFSAENLPTGLSLDPSTGIISGKLSSEGRTLVTLKVSGKCGYATRKLAIVGGLHKLALTPPLGWNSWNVWKRTVDDKKVRDAADWMVKTGLAAHGFQYINIDDTWSAERDTNGEIRSNEKFPDMKALVDYVHSKGLKLGIYSSPGPKSCCEFTGSYQHEEQDARTFAKWGVDYLKYDWCYYEDIARVEDPVTGEHSRYILQKPFRVMRRALDKCGRDIVYSMCEYGMGSAWEWGEEVGANLWRCNDDIYDGWDGMTRNGFSQDGHEKYAGPGHWNDPDMLVVGRLFVWGPTMHDSRLTPNAQITQVTLWSLEAAPLILGCDMTEMDKFTIDLLTNDEVLDVDQDPLGKAACQKSEDGDAVVWARPLWDGTTAVGLFNKSRTSAVRVTAKWSDLGITGAQPVRDLWRRKDLGEFSDSFSTMVPSEGAVLVKIGWPDKTDWEE